MPIPDFQSFMLPLLAFASDGREHSVEEARDALAREFELTPEERNELLPSGRQRRFDNRVAWSKSFLDKARLLNSPRRAHFQITERGKQLLAEGPKRIDIPLLQRHEEFREFRAVQPKPLGGAIAEGHQAESLSSTPEELLEQAHQSISADLATEVLARVKSGSSQFFETLVVELLLKMGYGRNRADPFARGTVGRFIPRHVTRRITAQTGLFTIHPEPHVAFQDSEIDRLIIKATYRKALKSTLFRYGIHRASLFPDLDGLSRHIEWMRTEIY
jgi:restriction endonuclease Mrr